MTDRSDDATFSIKRRNLLAGAAAGAGLLVSARVSEGAAPDPTRVQGQAPSAVGSRSVHEQIARTPFAGVVSATPLHELHGTLTPADLHFERHHGGVPRIDPGEHELLIHGLVDSPIKLTLGALKRFPSVTRTCFIECSGNYFTGLGDKSTPQTLCGLTSQSEWTGVPLSTLLREAGISSRASWLLAEGSDAAVMSRSIPIEKAMDDALVVYAQNGEAIRPEQGYPFRLLLPGWEGNTNVKWLRRIEAGLRPFMTREETSKYTDNLADGSIRQFSFTMDARSVITYPTHPVRLVPGWHEIRGLAWSGRGRVERVEVSTDRGRTWQAARLQGPVLPTAHTRFNLSWRWDGQATEIQSRVLDETGYLQPTLAQLHQVRRPGATNYHFNPIVGWSVNENGEIRLSETA